MSMVFEFQFPFKASFYPTQNLTKSQTCNILWLQTSDLIDGMRNKSYLYFWLYQIFKRQKQTASDSVNISTLKATHIWWLLLSFIFKIFFVLSTICWFELESLAYDLIPKYGKEFSRDQRSIQTGCLLQFRAAEASKNTRRTFSTITW